MDWSDAAARARLIDRVGPAEYNRQHQEHLEQSRDLRGIAAARACLRLHHEQMGLERESGDVPSTDVWHLLFSLRRYCEAAGVNFDATLADVKAEEPVILGVA